MVRLHSPRRQRVVQHDTRHPPLPAGAGEATIAHLDGLRHADGGLRAAEIRRNMQKVMQRDAAVFRTQSTLKEGCDAIDEIVTSFADVKARVLAAAARSCGGAGAAPQPPRPRPPHHPSSHPSSTPNPPF